MEEIKILEIDDTSYECKSLIEFSSLIKILFKLLEKQKNIENKIDYINNRIDEKENRLNNLEIQVTGESKSEDHKIAKSFQSTSNIPNISNQKFSPKTELIRSSSKDINNININNFQNEEKGGMSDDLGNNMNPDMIKKLFKRVKENEKKIFELTKKTLEHNNIDKKLKNTNELINNNIKTTDNLQKNLDELTKKFSDFKTEFENIKVKVEDFNIYDLFKGEGSNGGNLDVTKSLIMALENKVFKKFSYFDERYKAYDKDIFKIKEETKNNSSIVDGIKHITEKNNQQLKDLLQNYEEFNTGVKEKLETLEKELNDIKNNGTINAENKSLNEIIEKKIKDNEKNITNIIEKQINDKELHFQKKESQKSSKEEIENYKNNTKRFNEIEKLIRQSSEEIGAKNIKERLENIENELLQKLTKIEALELKNKIVVLEDQIKDESLKVETLQQQWDKIRSDITQIVKKLEFLNTEYAKLSFQRITSNSEKLETSVDLLKYVDKNEYNNNKKDVNNKFEKVRLAIENLGRNLENILSSLTHTVNEKDLINFQGVMKNTLDELKISIAKRFADKIETNKSLKYLETQLKTVLESTNRKIDGADNWLLAKKPLSNYLCASCESVIKGELDKKADYIPWNKYPSRDDKTYRMGHGFSRMLQMVNDDIKRSTNTDNINSNLFLNTNTNNLNNFNISNMKDSQKDEENSTNLQINNNNSNNVGNVKLPKVKSKNVNLNTNQSLNNLEINTIKDKKKDENENRMMTSPYDDHSLSTSNINRPQIMKIYKINKNATITQTQNNINTDTQHFTIQNLNVKKLSANENNNNNKLFNKNIKK